MKVVVWVCRKKLVFVEFFELRVAVTPAVSSCYRGSPPLTLIVGRVSFDFETTLGRMNPSSGGRRKAFVF